MPKKKFITPNLGRIVSLRLDEETWGDLIDLARKQGYSASGFMRNAVFTKLREQGVEPVTKVLNGTKLHKEEVR